MFDAQQAWFFHLSLIIAWCSIALGVFLPLAWYVGIRIVITPSVPPGLWWVHSGLPQRGAYVAACIPHEIVRTVSALHMLAPGFCDGFAPVMKHLAASTGDVVTVTSDGITVDGHFLPHSRRLASDTHGHIIPTCIGYGHYHLKAGTLWLMGDDPRSWDSRYYGPISHTAIIGLGTPLWVYHSSPSQ